MDGAPRRVLVRNRRSEQRHEPITAVLVDSAFEAMNFRADQLEAPLNDFMDLFGIKLLAERGVIREISEHDRHLPPLAFQCRPPAQDFLGKMDGNVRNKRVCRRAALPEWFCICWFRGESVGPGKLVPARSTEPRTCRHGRAAARALQFKRGPTLLAEARSDWVVELARCARHSSQPSRKNLSPEVLKS